MTEERNNCFVMRPDWLQRMPEMKGTFFSSGSSSSSLILGRISNFAKSIPLEMANGTFALLVAYLNKPSWWHFWFDQDICIITTGTAKINAYHDRYPHRSISTVNKGASKIRWTSNLRRHIFIFSTVVQFKLKLSFFFINFYSLTYHY